jgi:hypothetical protein
MHKAAAAKAEVSDLQLITVHLTDDDTLSQPTGAMTPTTRPAEAYQLMTQMWTIPVSAFSSEPQHPCQMMPLLCTAESLCYSCAMQAKAGLVKASELLLQATNAHEQAAEELAAETTMHKTSCRSPPKVPVRVQADPAFQHIHAVKSLLPSVHYLCQSSTAFNLFRCQGWHQGLTETVLHWQRRQLEELQQQQDTCHVVVDLQLDLYTQARTQPCPRRCCVLCMRTHQAKSSLRAPILPRS